MKHVFNTSEVAHVWANQLQDSGRVAAGNLYFEGKTIYSYGRHFPIATMTKDGTVLMTTRTYSKTTTKHINYVWSAISGKKVIYCYDPESASKGMHSDNFTAFDNDAKASAMKMTPRARKPEIYLNQIAGFRAQFTEYCAFFKIKITKRLRTKYRYVFIESASGGIQATEKERKAIERHRKARAKAEAIRLKQGIEDFRSFESNRIYDSELSYLRYNAAKKRIETSRDIQIPEAIAKKFYAWLLAQIQNGGCGVDGTKDCSYKILDYSVNFVSKDQFKIGCHLISMGEAEMIANQLNWKA